MTTEVLATSSFSLPDCIHDLRWRIDAALEDSLRLSPGCPATLRQAMEYALLAPGKRIRPLLTLLAAQACGGPVERALPAACAVEMVHAYSLVHDDLPAMDNDDYRRGRLTCHRQFGEALAILAGDALLTLAFDLLARCIRPEELAGRCCGILAEAAGACCLVGGQADDMATTGGPWTLEHLESIHRRKTGALILAAVRLGATVAAADHAARAALDDYGTRLGLAFQIADDLLDIRGDAAPPSDLPYEAAGKLTFPALLGVECSVTRVDELTREAGHALAVFGDVADPLRTLADYTCERARGAATVAG